MAGAALLGGAALGSMAMKGAVNKATKGTAKGVAKGLYGDMAGALDKGVIKNITVPEFSTNGPQMIYKEGKRGRAGKFKANGGTRGERKAMKGQLADMNQYVADMHGKPEELGWAGQKIRDAKDKWFKRPKATKANVNEAGEYGGLSASKLSIYDDLTKKAVASDYNVDADGLVKATDGIYNSAGNRAARRNEGYKNIVDDVELTNSIWDGNLEAKIAEENKKIAKENKKATGERRRKFGSDDVGLRSKKGMKASEEIKDQMKNEALYEELKKRSASGVDGLNYRITNPSEGAMRTQENKLRLEELRNRKKKGWTSNANMNSPVGKQINDYKANPRSGFENVNSRLDTLRERKANGWESNSGKGVTGPGNANGLGPIDSTAIDTNNLYNPQQAKADASSRKAQKMKQRLVEKRNEGRIHDVNKAEKMGHIENKVRNRTDQANFYENTWGQNGSVTKQDMYNGLFGKGGKQDQMAQKVRDKKQEMYQGLFGEGGKQDKAIQLKKAKEYDRNQKKYDKLFGQGGVMDTKDPYKGLQKRREAQAKKDAAARALAEKNKPTPRPKPIKKGPPVRSSGALDHFSNRKERTSQAVSEFISVNPPRSNAIRKQRESQF